MTTRYSFARCQEELRAELMRLKQAPWVLGVKISTCSNACPTCQKLRGKVFTVDEALKKMPIPNKDCTFEHNGKRGFCRCLYTAVLMDKDEFTQRVRRWLRGEGDFLDEYEQRG